MKLPRFLDIFLLLQSKRNSERDQVLEETQQMIQGCPVKTRLPFHVIPAFFEIRSAFSSLRNFVSDFFFAAFLYVKQISVIEQLKLSCVEPA